MGSGSKGSKPSDSIQKIMLDLMTPEQKKYLNALMGGAYGAMTDIYGRPLTYGMPYMGPYFSSYQPFQLVPGGLKKGGGGGDDNGEYEDEDNMGCKTSNDCPPGYKCVNGKCVEKNRPPQRNCNLDSDCPDGYVCKAGRCVPEEIIRKNPDGGKGVANTFSNTPTTSQNTQFPSSSPQDILSLILSNADWRKVL